MSESRTSRRWRRRWRAGSLSIAANHGVRATGCQRIVSRASPSSEPELPFSFVSIRGPLLFLAPLRLSANCSLAFLRHRNDAGARSDWSVWPRHDDFIPRRLCESFAPLRETVVKAHFPQRRGGPAETRRLVRYTASILARTCMQIALNSAMTRIRGAPHPAVPEPRDVSSIQRSERLA